jgi:DNA-binding NtrC family response regulator
MAALNEHVSVLFVDDEPAILRSIARVLSRSKVEVFTAEGAAAGLELLRSRRVDVLVSDIDMPGMNGLELLRIVRREHPSTLRMLLTGHATFERALHAINEGEVIRFFTKPFDAELFRRTLDALADRIARSRREGDAELVRSRTAELEAWVEATFPGALAVARGPGGDVEIDVEALGRAVAKAGDRRLAKLLFEDPATLGGPERR